MKYIALVMSGMADEPLEALDGRTPLDVAQKPNLKELAISGRTGRVRLIPRKSNPSSEASALTLLGYDSGDALPQRGPLNALALGMAVKPDEVVFACQLVTVADGKVVDDAAGRIGARESAALLGGLNRIFKDRGIRFQVSTAGNHVMVVRSEELSKDLCAAELLPPNALVGKEWAKELPHGKAGDFLKEILLESSKALENHDVNKVRIDLQENPANQLWVWSAGRTAPLPPWQERFGKSASIVSTANFMRGVASAAGLPFVAALVGSPAEFADLTQIVDQVADLLEGQDVIFVYLDYADEASYEGDYKKKIRWIEAFDQYVVGPLRTRCAQDCRFLVSSNHVTPVLRKAKVDTPAPIIIAGQGIEADESEDFSEEAASAGSLDLKNGEALLKAFLG